MGDNTLPVSSYNLKWLNLSLFQMLLLHAVSPCMGAFLIVNNHKGSSVIGSVLAMYAH